MSVELLLFQCGTVRLKLRSIKHNQGLDVDFVMPVPWYVIKHPNGNILIDGGNAEDVAKSPREYWGSVVDDCWPTMDEADFCGHAIKKAGLQRTDIRFVLLSHLHHDHAGAVGQFPNATHVVRRREYDYAFAPDWYAAPSYVRKDFDKPDLSWEFLDDEAVVDFYGDGSVRLIPTPGHTPGHQSFLVTLPKTGAMLLAVDAVPTLDHWNNKALLGTTTSMSSAVRSIERLHAIAERAQATVVAGHDPEAWSAFHLAPYAYT